MPDHDGHQMEIMCPFIYDRSAVPGVLAYLGEYFSRFSEASVGELIATLEERSTGRDDSDRETYTLTYSLALAPFDLGVTQRLRFHAAYDDRVDTYRIRMTITRLSGQDTNWVTVNKPFLEKLRRYLIHWRNLDRAQRAMYVEQAKQEFGGE